MSNDPSISQLRAFVVLGEELHFGRAAERLHVTQPPLSRKIRSLERELDVQLVERTTRKVTLTPAGEVFLAEARKVLQHLERAIDLATNTSLGHTRSWKVGYIESAGYRLVGSLLSRMSEKGISDTIELHEMHTYVQVAALLNGDIDVGLLRASAASHPDLEFQEAYEEPLMLAVPESHHLYGAADVRLSELMHEKFVVYDSKLGNGLFMALLQSCAAAGYVPHVSNHATSTPTLFSLVSGGQGIALVGSGTALVPWAGVGFLPVTDVPATSSVLCSWRKGTDVPVVRVILDTIREVMSEES